MSGKWPTPNARWRLVKEIAAPVAAGGIGANDKIVKKVLEEHPDVFESRTEDEAKALGRKSTATVWQLRPREDDEAESEQPEQTTLDEDAVDPSRVAELCVVCGEPIRRGSGNTSTRCGRCAKASLT